MEPVDCHCHLDFEQFDTDRSKVIDRSRKKLEFVINAGANFEHNRAALELGEKYPDFIVPTLGLHPTFVDDFDQREKIEKQIRDENPVAIGEIGLDYHHVTDNKIREEQERIFRAFLTLAEKMSKPVVVHSRDAEKDTVDILKEYSLPDVMLHCFNGHPELAREAASSGMKIGVTTQVMYSARVQELVSSISIENIMLETDSPFLYQGERNKPRNVIESVEKVSEIKDIEAEKVIEATTSNARNFFRK